MKIRIFDTKTFASHLFSGNPAKVCILPDWLDNQILHNIAMENNLSGVVFIRASCDWLSALYYCTFLA